jgi:hypothetical protein
MPMRIDEQLIAELSDAFAADVAELEPRPDLLQTLERDLRKPSPRRRRPAWARRGAVTGGLAVAVGLGGTALAGGVVAALLLLSSGTSVAFAGWTPAPKNLTTAQFRSVVRVARDRWNPRCSGAGGSIVLADVRGPYTYTLYVTNPDAQVRLATICLNGVEDGSGGFGAGHQWPPHVAVSQIHGFFTEYDALSPQPRGSRRPAFTEVGRAGARVRAVNALLSTGKKVRATVSHGWYLLWWPANEGHPKRLLVSTSEAPGKTSGQTYDIPDSNARLPVRSGSTATG